MTDDGQMGALLTMCRPSLVCECADVLKLFALFLIKDLC